MKIFKKIPLSSQAILIMLIAMFLYVSSDTITAYLLRIEKVNTFGVIWIRSLSQLILISILMPLRVVSFFVFNKQKIHVFIRVILLATTTFSFIQTLKYLEIANATAIAYLSPIVIAIFTHLFLKEKMRIAGWFLVLISFVGVVIVVSPNPSSFNIKALWGILSVVAYSLGQLIIRIQNSKKIFTNSWEVLFWLALLMFIASWFIVGNIFTTISIKQYIIGTIGGFIGLFGSFFMFLAFSKASPNVVAPFEYSRIIWVSLYSTVVFNIFPSFNTWIGIVIIIGSTIMITKLSKKSN